MKLGGFFCTCAKTSRVNYKKVKKFFKKDFEAFVVHGLLCTDDGILHIIDYARSDLFDAVLIGCTKKNKIFEELSEKLGLPFHYINLREHCGWVHGKKEATEKATRMINAKIAVLAAEEDILPHTMDTGSTILFIGSTPEIVDAAHRISRVADVKILAENLTKAGIPGDGIEVYLGRPLGISGWIGDFKVRVEPNPINYDKCISCGKCSEACPLGAISIEHYYITEECDLCLKCCNVCPVDAISFDRKPFEIHVAQIIASETDVGRRQGIYPVTGDKESVLGAALEGVINSGKKTKPLAVEADLSNCAAGKSRIVGCTLCVAACVHGAIVRRGDTISFNHDICEGCGACAAVCPVSIPKFNLAPREFLHLQIEALLQADLEKKVILFTCGRREELLDSLGRKRRGYYPVLPVFVPCLNTVSELEVLRAYELGAEGVILLGCEKCLHGAAYTSMVDFTRAVIGAYDLGERLLVLHSFDPEEFPTILDGFIRSLKKSNMRGGPIDVQNKRTGFLEVLRGFSKYTGTTPEELIDGNSAFGLIEVDDSKCTLCNTCSVMCPQEALQKEGEVLVFYHELCIACGLCAKSCPEKAITLRRALDLKNIINGGEAVVYRGEILRCPSCGKATISKNALRATLDRLGGHGSLDPELLKFCPDCRVLKTLGFMGEEEH